MSALYIHIPFCKQACHYCDFHFSTSLGLKSAMATAICREIELQAQYLASSQLQSVYFGGGTPSLLSEQELMQIFEQIDKVFSISADTEITLEANPDDLSEEKIKLFRQSPINRFSVGIQSFREEHLRKLHRAHSAQEAEACVKKLQDAGFQNLTIDLIYAIPADNHDIWEQDLQKAIALQVPHISAYSLTIEPNTVFGKWLEKGKIPPIDDDFAARQFEILVERLTGAGFLHYEISNFCKEGQHSKHNSNYWAKGEYLGIGPSAHSYNLVSRQFNISHNPRYIEALQAGKIPATREQLSPEDQANEYMLTSLRTMWGCDTKRWEALAQRPFASQAAVLQKHLERKNLLHEGNMLRLSAQGKLLADAIAADFFIL
mgnify:FL=1